MTETEWTFRNPTKILFGDDQLKSLHSIVSSLVSTPKVALVTGRSAAVANGWVEAIARRLSDITWTHLPLVPPEPAERDVQLLTAEIERVDANVAIALGGGSVIDCAKLASLIAYASLEISGVMRRELIVTKKQVRLIAIPTTAGSGSEVTPFAVAADDRTGLKRSLPNPLNYPDIAIVSPQFLASVPREVIADTGVDALAHALEALWSIHRNPVSGALGESAAAEVLSSLQGYADNPERADLRAHMARGATMAGMAFSNTFTAACHALSYPISARFGLSHGAGCAATLAPVADLNGPFVVESYNRIRNMCGKGFSNIPDAVRELQSSLPGVRTLQELEPNRADLDFIARNTFKPLMENNPVPMDEEATLEFLKRSIAEQ